MTLYTQRIGDGISLSVINTQKFKAGALTLAICAPLTERDYLRSLLLAGLMRRGCRAYPSMAKINKRLDMLYAASADIQSVIRGDVLCFTLTAELLEPRYAIDGTDILDGVMQTVSEILINPKKIDGTFPEDALRAEKALVRDMLAAEANDTGIYAATRLKEMMSRRRTFPTLEYLLSSIDTVTADELSEYHQRLLSLPIRVFYVGGEPCERIGSCLERHFALFSKNSSLCQPTLTPQSPCPLAELSEDKLVSQSKLGLGFRTEALLGTPKSATALMLNEIFGAGPASKLFLEVRERMGLCYYCYSSYSALSGNITVASGIEAAQRQLVCDSIFAELDQIKRGNISQAELVAAQKSLSFSYTQIYDSVHSLTSFYFLRELFGIKQTIEDCRAAVLSVRREQIAELAASTVYDTCFFLNGTAPTEANDE